MFQIVRCAHHEIAISYTRLPYAYETFELAAKMCRMRNIFCDGDDCYHYVIKAGDNVRNRYVAPRTSRTWEELTEEVPF